MPSRRGQRPKPILTGAGAITALRHLTTKNSELAMVINQLGRRILELPEVVGLRWDRESVTYDIAFVSTRGRQRAFVTFTTPSYRGTWKQNEVPPMGTLLVEVRVNSTSVITDDSDWLQPKQFRGQSTGDWHNGYIGADGRELEDAFNVIEQAYLSWI